MTDKIMMFFKSKNNEIAASVDSDSDDIEEVEMEEEQQEHVAPQLPTTPSSSELLKDWFTMLCNDISIHKYTSLDRYDRLSYYFGAKGQSNEYPILSVSSNKLTFKDFSVSLSITERERLITLFKIGIDEYYSNIFITKMNDLKIKSIRSTYTPKKRRKEIIVIPPLEKY